MSLEWAMRVYCPVLLPVCSPCLLHTDKGVTYRLPALSTDCCASPTMMDSLWNLISNSFFYKLLLAMVVYHSNRSIINAKSYLIFFIILGVSVAMSEDTQGGSLLLPCWSWGLNSGHHCQLQYHDSLSHSGRRCRRRELCIRRRRGMHSGLQ